MKRVFNIIVFVLMIGVLNAQQIVMFNHYFYKPMVYNPAFTGTSDAPNLMLINHTQWTGFKGGPQYNILTFDGNLINKNTGLGINIISDKKGVNSRIGGNISYSYKIRFKNKIHLQLGLSVGVVNQSIDFSKASVENQNDPSLFTNSQNKTTFDANAGLAFIFKDLEFGFAIPQALNNKLKYVSTYDARTLYTQSRHYMSSLKYKFFILPAKKEISISPQVLMRYLPNTPLQYDANVNFDWQNKFWLGATYKSNYAIGLNLGVVLFKQFSIGYSYDYITGSINKYAGLSHEIMLNIKFNKKKDKTELERENAEITKLKSQNLNKLLIQKLLKKVETVLDKDNPTSQEIAALMEEISAFFNDDSTDPIQETLNRYYKSLKNQAQGELNVLIKGKIILENDENNNDYSKTKITITDISTKKIMATCSPTLKDGKYFIILKPAKKYSIKIEKEGFQTYIKSFSLSGTPESYEINQEIKLIK
jgi:type IX secretion system PorP/SprF family membrane protein